LSFGFVAFCRRIADGLMDCRQCATRRVLVDHDDDDTDAYACDDCDGGRHAARAAHARSTHRPNRIVGFVNRSVKSSSSVWCRHQALRRPSSIATIVRGGAGVTHA
jgi:hypothetical protein